MDASFVLQQMHTIRLSSGQMQKQMNLFQYPKALGHYSNAYKSLARLRPRPGNAENVILEDKAKLLLIEENIRQAKVQYIAGDEEAFINSMALLNKILLEWHTEVIILYQYSMTHRLLPLQSLQKDLIAKRYDRRWEPGENALSEAQEAELYAIIEHYLELLINVQNNMDAILQRSLQSSNPQATAQALSARIIEQRRVLRELEQKLMEWDQTQQNNTPYETP